MNSERKLKSFFYVTQEINEVPLPLKVYNIKNAVITIYTVGCME